MLNRTQRFPARVLLVEDHALVRKQLRKIIEAEPDLALCGEAADVPAAQALIREQQPDLVILDIALKRSSGLDLLKDLSAWQPKPTVLVLSMHEETYYVERALRAGAAGYITKAEATFHFLAAVRQVLAGRTYLSEGTAGRLDQKRAAARSGKFGSPPEVLTANGTLPGPVNANLLT
jgi:DNA-binding NarL/FixJ family response regulator